MLRLLPRRRLVAVGLAVLAGVVPLVTTGCRRALPAESVAGPVTPAVLVVQPFRQALTVAVEQPGRVQAIERTPIFARIPGYVGEVCVDMNHRVRKGQVLARLDVPEVEAEYQRKAALVRQARAEIEQAQRARDLAEANLVTARARIQEAEAGRLRAESNRDRWRVEHQRVLKLVAQGVMDGQTREEVFKEFQASESARDETEARVALAVAAHKESAAGVARARADVAAAEARLTVAEADERYARSMLDYREIRAPFDGLVTRRHVHTGHLLRAGVGETGNEPLFVVVRTDRARIFVEVPEAESVYVQQGSRAVVRTQASRSQDIEARVERISWVLEQSNRTLQAEIEMDASDQVRPGMYAYAVIHAEHPATWTLPLEAVVFRDEGAYCCQLVDGAIRRTPLRVGARNGTLVEVLEKGVADPSSVTDPGWQPITGQEVVVRNNSPGLKDGQAVRVEKAGE